MEGIFIISSGMLAVALILNLIGAGLKFHLGALHEPVAIVLAKILAISVFSKNIEIICTSQLIVTTMDTSKRNRTAILPSGGECTIHYAMEAYIRILAGLEMKITIEGVYAVIDPEYGAYESYIIVIGMQGPLRYRIDVLWEV